MDLGDLEEYARGVKDKTVALLYGLMAAQDSVERLKEWAALFNPDDHA